MGPPSTRTTRSVSTESQAERERFAYEVLLNKFDLMLMKARVERGKSNRGLVIHDRRVVVERDIQTWTAGWRKAAGAFSTLWPAFHREGGVAHGCVHYTPSFGQGSCTCPPCDQRLTAEATSTRVAAAGTVEQG